MDTPSLNTRRIAFPGPGASGARVLSLLTGLIMGAVPAGAFVGNLEAIAAPMGSVFLRWEDLTTGESGFRIERQAGSEEFVEVAVAPPDSLHFTDTGLEPDTPYTYRVRAFTPDRELPAREATVRSLPSWAAPRAHPRLQSRTPESLVLRYEGEGATYSLETSPDLEQWNPLGEPFFLGTTETRDLELPLGAGQTFARVRSAAFERPTGVGLSMPFALPPEPDGEIYDVTDFGASPISPNNDDAVGIKVALSLASPGDTVFIPAGTYLIRQVLEVPSGVTLRGAGMDETRLLTEGIDRAITILPEVHDVRLSGFSIQYLGATEELAFGIYVGSSRQGLNSYRLLIDGIRVEGFSVHGVSLRDCHHVLVQNCEFLNATNLGGGGHGYGVALNYPTNHNNWIRHNTIGPVIRHAVLIQYEAHNNLVEYNLAVENTEDAYDLHGEDESANELRFNIARDGDRDGFGVGNTGSTHDRSGPHNWIHHNTVENCLAGLEIIQGSDMVYVDHNTFVNNRYGIRVHNLGGDHLYIRGNRLEGNEIGISLTDARWVWLQHNQLIGQSLYGIEVLSQVEDLVEEGNQFSGNAADRRP